MTALFSLLAQNFLKTLDSVTKITSCIQKYTEFSFLPQSPDICCQPTPSSAVSVSFLEGDK